MKIFIYIHERMAALFSWYILMKKLKTLKAKFFELLWKKSFFQFNLFETINIQKWFGNNPNFKNKPNVLKKTTHPKIKKKFEPKHWKIKYFKEE